MKTVIAAVLVLVGLVGAQPLNDEQMKKAETYALGCLETHKSLDKESLTLLRDGDFSKVNQDTKCFLRCFLQRAGFMDDAGNLLDDYAIERLSISQDKAKVESLVKKCSVKLEDSCETAFQAVKCYQGLKASLL